jgi:hypothetical protein
MKFLFVHWFGSEPRYRGGWSHNRLDRIGFLKGPEAFGFIDPDVAIRAVHLIPAFALGRTDIYLSRSRYRDAEGDYTGYYVNQ